MELLGLLEGRKIITFMGLAKNTGKTVVLNKIIKELNSIGKRFAVTSTGFDGEDNDSINYLIEKPKIFVPNGNFIATTDSLTRPNIQKLKIIKETDFYTPLGYVIIAKVIEDGEFKIAGPSTVNDMMKLIKMIGYPEIDKILIDGAINRKAMSSPMVSDGFILSTGAVLNFDIDEVIKETKNFVKLISIPVDDNPRVKEIFEKYSSDVIIGNENKIVKFDNLSALNNVKVILDNITDEMDFLIIKTSVNDSFINQIFTKRKGKYFRVIVYDTMKLFTLPSNINKYEKKGISIKVLNPSKLIAITINPVAPLSHNFDSDDFLCRLRKAIPSIPVFDVMRKDNFQNV